MAPVMRPARQRSVSQATNAEREREAHTSMKSVTCIYTVTVELDETGEGHAFVTSEAGEHGHCKIGYNRSSQTISGYCDLGAILLDDASEEWMR
jgi:hypothetical protein